MNTIHGNRKTVRRICFAILLILFAAGLILFNASIKKTSLRASNGTEFVKAEVVEVLTDDALFPDNGPYQGNQLVKVKILSGDYKGELCEAQNPNSYLSGAYCKEGTRVILMLNGNGRELSASVFNYDRGNMLWLFIGLFMAVLCIIGKRKGILSAIALVFTFICIIFLYLPMLYIGISPVFSGTLVCVLTTVVTMLLIGGWSVKTLCAVLGTAAGIMVAGMVAALFSMLLHVTGYNVQDIESIIYISQNSRLHVGGILYSGILIASMGAVMDISISVVSSINEIYMHNPGAKAQLLFRSGINVGRDMMGTMSNTLILAFAGGSINTLILYYSYNMPYLQVMNQYAIAIEILHGLSATLGVIMTVPLVSAITSILLVKYKHQGNNKMA